MECVRYMIHKATPAGDLQIAIARIWGGLVLLGVLCAVPLTPARADATEPVAVTAAATANPVEALIEQGAEKVYACASHAVLSGPAVERIANSRLEELVVTNTIPLREDAQQLEKTGKIRVLSIAGLLGRAIESIHMETSVSTLFN